MAGVIQLNMSREERKRMKALLMGIQFLFLIMVTFSKGSIIMVILVGWVTNYIQTATRI
jgi:hypothetical protein